MAASCDADSDASRCRHGTAAAACLLSRVICAEHIAVSVGAITLTQNSVVLIELQARLKKRGRKSQTALRTKQHCRCRVRVNHLSTAAYRVGNDISLPRGLVEMILSGCHLSTVAETSQSCWTGLQSDRQGGQDDVRNVNFVYVSK